MIRWLVYIIAIIFFGLSISLSRLSEFAFLLIPAYNVVILIMIEDLVEKLIFTSIYSIGFDAIYGLSFGNSIIAMVIVLTLLVSIRRVITVDIFTPVTFIIVSVGLLMLHVLLLNLFVAGGVVTSVSAFIIMAVEAIIFYLLVLLILRSKIHTLR